MNITEIKKDIFWVGAVDWGVRTFHGHTYSTQRGSTYNAYLIRGEKNVLVDTVHAPFAAEMIQRIRQVIDPAKIDYIIVNHVETDHSGALPEIVKLCPKAKLMGTAKCQEGLEKHYYAGFNFQVVKTGERLNLGSRSLHFIEAPMIHWPDSMFTYCPEEKLLLPNDAFGQHYASAERYDDEVDQAALMDEAAKYYANILWPLSGLIARKIDDIQKMNIAIDMIAPSHGIIWRADPGKILKAYIGWAGNLTRPKAIVVYETMWGATEKMARAIIEGLTDSGVTAKLFDVTGTDRTEIIKEMLDAKGFIFGSSTHDNDMLPTMGGFLELFKGMRPLKRIGCAFGSFGWAGGAVKEIEGVLKEAGVETALPGLSIKYVPSVEELRQCHAFGQAFAEKVVNSNTPR